LNNNTKKSKDIEFRNTINNLNYLYSNKEKSQKQENNIEKKYIKNPAKIKKFYRIRLDSNLVNLKKEMNNSIQNKVKDLVCIFPSCDKVNSTYYKWHTHFRTHVNNSFCFC